MYGGGSCLNQHTHTHTHTCVVVHVLIREHILWFQTFAWHDQTWEIVETTIFNVHKQPQ